MRARLGMLTGFVVIGVVLVGLCSPPATTDDQQGRTIRIRPNIRLGPALQLDLRPMVPVPPEVDIDLDHLRAPDIIIDRIQFFPSTYVPTQRVHVRVILHNAGVETSGPCHVRWKPHATHPGIVKYVPSLREGVGGDIDFDYEFTRKTEETFAEVDCYDEVAERNERNNQAQAHPMIGADAWDFYVEDIWLTQAEELGEPELQPTGGEDVEVCYSAGFVNTINDERFSTWVDAYVDGEVRHSWHFHIPANGTHVVHFSLNVGAGEHTIRVVAREPLAEANTANNDLTKTFTWRGRPQPPFNFEYFAINDYDAIGGGGNLHLSLNEGRRFGHEMIDRGHSCVYLAEDDDVDCADWGYGADARVNVAEIVYYAGHGDYNGPWYSDYGADDAGVLQMEPSKYRFGRNAAGQPTLRWCTWSACSTLYDGVRDSSHANWWNGQYALSRWFPAFTGLHSIMGMRSLGWQGEWYEASTCYIRDTRQRASKYLDMLDDGYTFTNAWFMANRQTVYDHLGDGFEAAVLAASTEGTNYGEETLWPPFADYVGIPGGFFYACYRIGSPSW